MLLDPVHNIIELALLLCPADNTSRLPAVKGCAFSLELKTMIPARRMSKICSNTAASCLHTSPSSCEVMEEKEWVACEASIGWPIPAVTYVKVSGHQQQ